MDAASSAPVEPTGQASADQAFKRTAAAHLAEVLTDATARAQLVGVLRQRSSLPLSELTAMIGDIDADVGSSGVPEVWLREPPGARDSADLLVAYAPAGNWHTWTEIPAYKLGGTRVTLDPQHAPDASVLVIETHGRLAMSQDIAEANLMLQRAGLQRVAPKTELSVAGIQTTRLDSIRLVDDEEPWISGAAEV